ncbi:MAG: ATP-dependent helicase [Lachnospiraceae bacterium]|nr:ATP-dependent helicase [Lachnospiraceae bacterium]
MINFNNEQLTAVRHVDGPMLVLAGPGSGKTQVIAGRVLHLIRDEGIDPSGILVLTFSRAAAAAMSSRFFKEAGTSYPVTFGTFHAIFYHIIKRQGLYKTGTILTHKRKTELLKITAMRLGIDRYKDKAWIERMLSLIGLNKAGMIEENDDVSNEERELLKLVFMPYVSLCKCEDGLDFDDMINECLKALKCNDKILKKWQEKYRYILVDEFQDIDLRQYEVLKLLSGDNGNLFCVGDDDQSIYSFRGACPGVMKRMLEDFSGTKVCTLKINYRCPENVIWHASRLINVNRSRFPKEQECFDRSFNGNIDCFSAASSDEEARICLDIIKGIINESSVKGQTTGVLYRTRGSADMTENLLRRSLIPYERRDGSGNRAKQEWEDDIAAYLRLAVKGSDTDLLRILNRPDRGLTRECVYDRFPDKNAVSGYYACDSYERKRCERLFDDIERIGGLNGFGALNYILRVTGLGEYIKHTYFADGREEEYESEMERLMMRSRDFDSPLGLLGYLDDKDVAIEQNVTPDPQKEECMIKLMTIHASKGLEFDNIILIGLQEGIFPGKMSDSGEALEEERRLFYVAITRCRRNLYIIGQNKDNYGKRQSRFITEAGFEKETVGSIRKNMI